MIFTGSALKTYRHISDLLIPNRSEIWLFTIDHVVITHMRFHYETKNYQGLSMAEKTEAHGWSMEVQNDESFRTKLWAYKRTLFIDR
ncbi:hypothetical protein FHE72_04510 [Rossellomorea vietnamensis]|uniref:NERD domain-containing protein n=1 Tax=Rossellomorea vietnamensis TaxID=218284 RepID=A0A6I6UCE7_9BACI|nr:hypothetical protein FHE72_04510 [Rossellomorea vietnamensis]